MKRLAIIAPIFPPSTGGAATYYKMLAEALISEGAFGEIHVYTEKASAKTDVTHPPGLIIHRIFPERAGRKMPYWLRCLLYAWQNILYFPLAFSLARSGYQTILVHSSFHNYPGLFHFAMQCLSLACCGSLVCDVRDRLLRQPRLRELSLYDRVIACSEGVFEHLQLESSLNNKVALIPVIQDSIVRVVPNLNQLRALGIEADVYLISIGVVKPEKGFGQIPELLPIIHHELGLEIDWLVVGEIKDQSLEEALRQSGVILTGSLPRFDVLSLVAGATLHVNLSSEEGLPRCTLEAIDLGTPVIVAQGIPEFDHSEIPLLFEGDSLDQKAIKIARVARGILSGERAPAPYALDKHRPRTVIPEYRELLIK